MRGQGLLLGTLALASLLLFAAPGFAEDSPTPPATPVDPCLKTCALNADCGTNGFCQDGTCKPVDNYCHNERWSMNDRGEGQNCNAYRCETETGLCLRTAQSSSSCTLGYVFDGKGLCVPSVNCSSNDEGCQDLRRKWRDARAEYETSTPNVAADPLTCRSCQTSEQCGPEEMCAQNRCVKERPVCTQDIFGAFYSVFKNKFESCAGFQCDVALGECLKTCFSQFDCQSGFHCESGQCKINP